MNINSQSTWAVDVCPKHAREADFYQSITIPAQVSAGLRLHGSSVVEMFILLPLGYVSSATHDAAPAALVDCLLNASDACFEGTVHERIEQPVGTHCSSAVLSPTQ